MKQIVKPRTPHMLMLNAGEVVHDHRPSVITQQDYVNDRVARGQIEVLEKELPDDASDAEFEKIWNSEAVNRDDKKAIAEFMKHIKADHKKAEK